MDIKSITTVFEDGSVVTTSGPFTAVDTSVVPVPPAPTDTEIDVVLSDGTVKKFVPAV